jgi:hypothetical protein
LPLVAKEQLGVVFDQLELHERTALIQAGISP